MRDTTMGDLAVRFEGATQSRLDSVSSALAEMRADAAILAEMRLTFVEPLIQPALAERWIENGGSVV